VGRAEPWRQAEIKSIFVLYDTNNNGILEKKELIEALSATGRARHGARRGRPGGNPEP
jgi:Ca2+-binding EF-hand superfamily protein